MARRFERLLIFLNRIREVIRIARYRAIKLIQIETGSSGSGGKMISLMPILYAAIPDHF